VANPNPSPETRAGAPRGPKPGRRPGAVARAAVLARIPRVRSLQEIRADPRWLGTSMTTLMRCVAEDPEQPLDMRLACAERLLRLELDRETGSPLERLSVSELSALIEFVRAERAREEQRRIEAERNAPAGQRISDAEVIERDEPEPAAEPART
jgi:hypothetical protein